MGINITVTCSSCKGVGSRIIGYDEQNNPIYEDPCTGCGGDGKTTTGQLDDTVLIDKLDTIISGLQRIWNKLNE